MSRFHCFAFSSLSLLLLVTLTACHSATVEEPSTRQGRQGRGGRGGGATFLLSNETVQKDLAMTDAQKASLKKISDDFQSSMSDLSQEERQTQMPELIKGMGDQMNAVLDDKQKARMKEIQLQQQGATALATPELAGALKLTDDQINLIKALNKDLDDALFEATKGSGELDPTYQDKYNALRTDTPAKILAVLTTDQKAAFEKMQGAKIDLPAGGFGGFGGRNNGGGRRNRGANGGGRGPGGGAAAGTGSTSGTGK